MNRYIQCDSTSKNTKEKGFKNELLMTIKTWKLEYLGHIMKINQRYLLLQLIL